MIQYVHLPQSTFTRFLILCYSACAAGYNSLPIPVYVHHFLQLHHGWLGVQNQLYPSIRGHGPPPPEPSPIRNYKLCRLVAMMVFCMLVMCFNTCALLHNVCTDAPSNITNNHAWNDWMNGCFVKNSYFWRWWVQMFSWNSVLRQAHFCAAKSYDCKLDKR